MICEHIPYSQRDIILNKYIERKKNKYNEYIKSDEIHLYNNKWWDNDDKLIDINAYITYQKTLIDERKLKQILNESYNILDGDIKNKYGINLFFKYQQSLNSMLH